MGIANPREKPLPLAVRTWNQLRDKLKGAGAMGDSKDEYLRADMWTIKEGINLLAGQDVYTDDDTIKDGLPSEIRDFAINLEWHTLRAQKAGMLQVVYEPHGNNHLDKVLYRHVRPKEFITWANQKGFPIPIELGGLLHGIQIERDKFSKAWDDAIMADKIKLKITEIESAKLNSAEEFQHKEALLQEMRCEIDRLLAGEQQSPPLEVTQHVTVDSVNPRRGRRARLRDTECLIIYRKHYIEGLSIARLSNDYNWRDSPFADNPTAETAKSRIKSAIKRGRDITPFRDRPEIDTKLAETGSK